MRGTFLVFVAVAALLVTASSTLAQGPSGPPQDPFRAGIDWIVPSVAYAGHPLHAAVAVAPPSDASGLESHVDLSITVTLDDVVQFETQSVHEHDGFHTLVIMPKRAGILRLYADQGAGSHEHDGQGSGTPTAMMAEIPILDAPFIPLDEATHGRPSLEVSREQSIGLRGPTPHYGLFHSGLAEVVDAQGRLIMSQWFLPLEFFTDVRAPLGGWGDGRLEVLYTSHAGSNSTVFTETFSHDLKGPSRTTVRYNNPLSDDDRPPCDLQTLAVLTDPDPVIEDGLAWQQWTDVRFAVARQPDHTTPRTHHNPHTSYRVLSGSVVPSMPGEESDGFFWQDSYDPFREATLAFHAPGTDTMLVDDSPGDVGDGAACRVEFTILPNTDNDPGEVIHEVKVDNASAAVVLAAIRGYDNLPHYEFDTRVYRLHTEETPGRLAWKGKLHGHQGVVSFRVHDLEPGDYEIRTYPSPQDLGTPPVAADSEGGFVYRFTIEAPSETEPRRADETDPQALPAPAGIALVALVGVALSWWRRR